MTKTSKVLIMIRTSTENQSIENQHNEMVEFCKQRGYLEENMIFIEEQGASAIKLNDKYKAQIKAIKDTIENDTDIDCFACWHLNRAFRNEEAYLDLKSFMVPRKIQMLVKNPSLELLNPDGTINKGMELAMGLFAILNKQEDEERKEKFKRTKKANAAKGKFNGGINIKFGYKVGENKYFEEDEIDGPIVRLIFELYSTGQYSTLKLANEINNRGIVRKNGKPLYAWVVEGVLSSNAYTGAPNEKYNNRVYPALITEELFLKCEEVRKSNKRFERKSEVEKKVNLASRLIRCTKCGKLYISDGLLYRCNGNNKREAIYCDNSLCINKKVMDELLWRVASTCHLDYLMEMSDDKLEEYKRELEITEQKITTISTKLLNIGNKKLRIVETYLEGLINKENRDLKLNKLQEEVSTITNEIIGFKETKKALSGLIESYAKKDEADAFMNGIDAIDSANKYNIVHQHIKEVKLYRFQYGLRPKKGKDNGVDIQITSILGKTWRFMYIPNAKKKEKKLFIWNA